MMAPSSASVVSAALDAAAIVEWSRKLGAHFGFDPDKIAHVVTAAAVNSRAMEYAAFHKRVGAGLANDR